MGTVKFTVDKRCYFVLESLDFDIVNLHDVGFLFPLSLHPELCNQIGVLCST